MASDFVTEFTKPLLVSLSNSDYFPAEKVSSPSSDSSRNQLQALLGSLEATHLSPSDISRAVEQLHENEAVAKINNPDGEEGLLKHAIVSKLVVALYAGALDTHLAQAAAVESEAQWWADVERSRVNVAWYLLQTLPLRLANLVKTIVQTLRRNNLPLNLATLHPSSLKHLFESMPTSNLRPGTLLTSLFPQPLPVTSSAYILPTPTNHTSGLSLKNIWANIFLPLALARQECRYNRAELENIRDEKAKVLGDLALMRGDLGVLVANKGSGYSSFLESLIQTVSTSSSELSELTAKSDAVHLIYQINTTLPSLSTRHASFLRQHHLIRPSTLTLLWPKLVFLPPLAFYTLKFCYSQRTAFFDILQDARETVTGFVRGWLMEPLKEVLRTVRAGGAEGEQGVIVRKEGVFADLESLERMTLSLAADVLHYTPEQLDSLSDQVKAGVLTPVMRIYEEEMRHPLKSAIAGNLVRGVLVQVQKAKVDIDQALTGIDRLLKSQELTFAFVGVAPALAVVYFAFGVLGSGIWNEAGRVRTRYGGPTRRGEVWSDMRRIERLLITQPSKSKSRHGIPTNPDPLQEQEHQLPALSTGLILLSVTRLRTYAQQCLPSSSSSSNSSTHTYPSVGGMRLAFLEDVTDLEDPGLGRHAKTKVVERMWRCWGDVLGWRDKNA